MVYELNPYYKMPMVYELNPYVFLFWEQYFFPLLFQFGLLYNRESDTM